MKILQCKTENLIKTVKCFFFNTVNRWNGTNILYIENECIGTILKVQ